MKNLILISIAALFLTGCFSPINSVHDTAKLLEIGEVQMKGNYSVYANGIETTNTNIGGSAAVGIHEKVNLGLRYEQLKGTDYNLYDNQPNKTIKYDYFEARAKFRLYKDYVAFETPVSIYRHEGNSTVYSFDPRLYLSYRVNKHIDFTQVNKLSFFKGVTDNAMLSEGTHILPGFMLGMGLSSDLDKWAIRPEVGYNGYYSAGVAFTYNFKL